MERNTKIAKQLMKIAKELVSMARFTDGLGEDSDNSNATNDRQYERILREMYNPRDAESIINQGRGADMGATHKGTMGNGNLIMKYETFGKTFIIMGLVSEKKSFARKGDMNNPTDREQYENDKKDIYDLFKFLESVVNKGYVIATDCNRFSIVFLTAFYRLHQNEYEMSYGREHDFGSLARMHGSNNLSKSMQVWKKGVQPPSNCDIEHVYDIDAEKERRFSKNPRTNEQVRRIQQRREQELINIVKEREGK